MKDNFTEELLKTVQIKWKITLILIQNSTQTLHRHESIILQLANAWVSQSLCKLTMFNREGRESLTMKADTQAIGSSAEKLQKPQYNM